MILSETTTGILRLRQQLRDILHDRYMAASSLSRRGQDFGGNIAMIQ